MFDTMTNLSPSSVYCISVVNSIGSNSAMKLDDVVIALPPSLLVSLLLLLLLHTLKIPIPSLLAVSSRFVISFIMPS